jgi:hypothetical protein
VVTSRVAPTVLRYRAPIMRGRKRAGIIATLTEMTSELIDVDLAPLRRAPVWLRNWGSFHHFPSIQRQRAGRAPNCLFRCHIQYRGLCSGLAPAPIGENPRALQRTRLSDHARFQWTPNSRRMATAPPARFANRRRPAAKRAQHHSARCASVSSSNHASDSENGPGVRRSRSLRQAATTSGAQTQT